MTKRAAGEGHVRQRADGRWEARIPDPTAKAGYRSVYAPTQRAVVLKARRERQWPVVVTETLGALMARWLTEHVARRRRPLTWQTYHWLAKNQILPALGDAPVAALTPAQVDAWLRQLERSGLAPATVSAAHACLKSCLTWAERQEIVTRNVAKLVEGVGVTGRQLAPLTPTETRALMAQIGVSAYAGPLLSCLWLGLRLGEACGLAWADVGETTVQVRRQLQAQRGKGLVLTDLKTRGSRRVLALPAQLGALMAARRWQEDADRGKAGIKWRRQYDDWGLVWRTPLGCACRPSLVRAAFARSAASVGRPELTPHALRHQHASLLFDAGVSVRRVAEQLGHNSQATTSKVYIHVLPQAAAEIPGVVERWLDDGGSS